MADLRREEARRGPNYFNFMQFLGAKNWPNNSFSHPPLELAHPSGDPGSATACVKICLESVSVSVSVSVTEWVQKVFCNHYANTNGYRKPSDTICTLHPSSANGYRRFSIPIGICIMVKENLPYLKHIQKLKQIRGVSGTRPLVVADE